MAKDRKKLLHIHSSIADKQPTAASLEVGEIAVNNAANQEFLSIKNSNNVVKRFSSDEQIVAWMEKKEVMPYEGYTRGSDGPSGTTGPDSVTNDDLLQNKSNIIIKLNQVVASNTAKHNIVNGAKDIYGKCVNPTSDSGVTDGAGFAIDMSRYAMIGANPSFSSVTVTDKTDLSGNTTIADGDGSGTRTGHTLAIKTTDVVANDTNWTETITNKQSTVANESDNITTLNESATTRNTTVGAENLHVSGTTTEAHDDNVTIVNHGDVAETTDGNVTEHISGNTTFNTIGNTVIHSNGAVGITAVNDITAASSESSIFITANDNLCATAGDIAAIKGVNKTNVGIDCSDGARTKVANVYGDTINLRGDTADTRVISAYTSAVTVTAAVGEANLSGTSLDITSCGRISANTNDFEVKQCTVNGKFGVDMDDVDIDSNTFDAVGAVSASIKAPATTISGSILTIDEASTVISACTKIDLVTNDLNIKQCSNAGGSADFEFCDGFNVKSNDINFEQCDVDGMFTVKADATSISGETLTIRESGATDFSGNTLTITTNDTLTINTKGNAALTSSGKTCIQTSTDLNIGGDSSTKIGANCEGNAYSDNTTIYGTSAVTIDTPKTIISGDTVFGGNVSITGVVYGLEDLTIQYGTDVSNRTSATTYDGSSINTIDIPTTLGQVSAGHVSDSAPTETSGTITIDKDTNISKAATISSGLTVSSNGANITGNTQITGNLDVNGIIRQTSDINLKENINRITSEELDNVALIEYKSFNLKDDKDKNKMYGVIAQEVQEAGLGELVYTKEDKTLAVDYTSLMILKLAKLTKDCDNLLKLFVYLENKIAQLEAKVNELENKD